MSKSCRVPDELQVLARHLGNVGRRVPEEVVRVRRRVELADARADDLAAAARDDHGARAARRRACSPSGSLPSHLASAVSRVADRADDELLPLLVEDVALLGLAACRERLLARRAGRRASRVAIGCRVRASIDGATRFVSRSKSSSWAVLPMIFAAAAGILDAGQLDRDLVVALRADLGLGDAEPVDAVAHDRDRAVEVLLRQLAVARRHRLLRHLEAALEVEAERRRLLERRRRGWPAARRRRGRRRPGRRR